MIGKYINEANINFFASFVSHDRYNLYAYIKKAVLQMVATIKVMFPVQPNNHGNKLKGTIANE